MASLETMRTTDKPVPSHDSLSPGVNPTIASYNASAVKNYNAAGTLLRFESKYLFFYYQKTL
jgi:hypothetical protein